MLEKKLEMGGFLPLHVNSKYGEYYKEDAVGLNTARNSILLAVKDGKYSRVLVPLYICRSVIDVLKRYGYEIDYYHLNDSFQPILTEGQRLSLRRQKTVILIVNYFGVYFPSRNFVDCKNLIIDNTQAFYEHPNKLVYNVYSCRKFFGVSDGAYLVKSNIYKYDFPRDDSSKRSQYLINSFENGTNSTYQEYLKAEKNLSNAEIMLMSNFTKEILKSIDYNEINQIRLKNFFILHDSLMSFNELNFDYDDINNSPMVYPLLIESELLRKKLLEHKIYISQWWKWCIETNLCNDFEKKLSKYLIPLPIDQRYSEKEMQYLIKIIKSVF